MPRHLRLVYASRATFPPIRDGAGIHPEVARILVQSRRNNARQRLYGGLYYADGSSFTETMSALLSREEKKSFGQFSMLNVNRDLKAEMRRVDYWTRN